MPCLASLWREGVCRTLTWVISNATEMGGDFERAAIPRVSCALGVSKDPEMCQPGHDGTVWLCSV